MPTQVAAVQAGSLLFDTQATVAKLADLLSDAVNKMRGKGPRLVVFPEAFIGGYPKGNYFGAPVGSRSDEGRDLFSRYFAGGIDVPGSETAMIAEMARDHCTDVVVGVVEREGGTLYCSVLCFSSEGVLLGKRRKLMPTAAERVVWGFGDGSTLDCFDAPSGRLASVICWENYMPMLRMSQYAQGVQVYTAPTVDDRPVWNSTMTTIALEGRCFVVSASQFLTRQSVPDDFETVQGEQRDTVLINGGSVIVSPLGQLLCGPSFGNEDTLHAELDLTEIARGKMDFDVVGHYARPDIFRLEVDRTPKQPVSSNSKAES
ncbi:MAG: carbon-nitrogen hydrolase family protein [Planctomycetota bacterium]